MLPTFSFVLGDAQVVVSLHAVAVALGVAAGGVLAARRATDPAPVLASAAVVAVATLVGAHALFTVLHGSGAGGLASVGGVAAGLLATVIVARLTRRPTGELLDALVPAALLALAIGRIGCFLAGCCYGRSTTLPWGTVFPSADASPRHPLQLYSAAGDLAIVRLLPTRAGAPGTIAARGFVGFGLLRAALELLRDHATTDLVPPGWITLPQVAALFLVVAGSVMLHRLRRPGRFDYASSPEDTRAWRMRSR